LRKANLTTNRAKEELKEQESQRWHSVGASS
jgi:hypothetical protein